MPVALHEHQYTFDNI